MQQDPLPEQEEEDVDSSSNNSSDEEAPPSSPPGEAAEEGDIPGGLTNLSVLESFRTYRPYPYGTRRYICILLMF